MRTPDTNTKAQQDAKDEKRLRVRAAEAKVLSTAKVWHRYTGGSDRKRYFFLAHCDAVEELVKAEASEPVEYLP